MYVIGYVQKGDTPMPDPDSNTEEFLKFMNSSLDGLFIMYVTSINDSNEFEFDSDEADISPRMKFKTREEAKAIIDMCTPVFQSGMHIMREGEASTYLTAKYTVKTIEALLRGGGELSPDDKELYSDLKWYLEL